MKRGAISDGLKLVVDNKIPYLHGQAEKLGTVHYLPGVAITAADVREADVLIVRTRTRCDRALLEGSSVKFVATATIGFDHLDTDYLNKAGIGWANCPGCNAASVGQYVSASLIRLARAGFVRLDQCRVGIVGVGHVGTAVDKAVRTLGCTTLLCDPPRAEVEHLPDFVPMDTIYREADVITFHTPLTREGRWATLHLADFSRMVRRPVVINAARGEVVDNGAWLQALQDGKVSAAVVDTWENEPRISPSLLERAFIATPHIAGYSADGKATGSRMALEAVARYFHRDVTFDIQPPALPASLVPADDPLDRALQLYDPLTDTAALKAHPERFEWLRANYPLRREYF